MTLSIPVRRKNDTERYPTVNRIQTSLRTNSPPGLPARYSAFRFSTSSATFRERMTLYLS